jgi:hypothetical protein
MYRLTDSEPLIRLPEVTCAEVADTYLELGRISDGLPHFRAIMSTTEAKRHSAERARASGVMTHAEVLGLIVPITETLFDDSATVSLAFHAQLMVMFGFPTIPESLALQTAFGRRVGEQQHLKLVRLSDRAQRRGLSVDEYVDDLRRRNAVEHDHLVRKFLGKISHEPDESRLETAVSILRRTAALAPEELRPPVLCAIAWMLWARGRGVLALAHLAEALRIEPGHVLACGLMLHFSGTTPKWTRSWSWREKGNCGGWNPCSTRS